MKRVLFILVLVAVSINVVADDLIITNDSKCIKAKVVEVSKKSIKYKDASYPEGPIFVIETSEILNIVYENGQVQNFSQNNATPVTTSVPASSPVSTPAIVHSRLSLRSEPLGATIFVDGNRKGLTPMEMVLNDGEHTICLELKGYITCQNTIVLSSGERMDTVIPLQPEAPVIPDSMYVKVVSNIPTLRKLDRLVSDTAETGTYHLPCGRHYIELKADGYLSKSQYFYVNKQSDTCAYSFKMKPRPKKQFFFMIDYNWGDIRNTSSLGFRVGQTQLVGWYATMNVSLVGSHYGYDKETLPLTIDKASRNKIAVMGGINLWLGCPLYFYTGIGYGYQGVSYRNNAGIWHRGLAKDNIGHGVAWECGLQGNIKGFTPRLGYALIGGDFLMNEVSVGIGYTFKSK